MSKCSIKLFFIPLLFIGLISCEDSKLTEPVPTFQEGMIPLKVGFKWTYKVSIFDESGILVDTHFYSVEVVKDTLIDNEIWFFLGLDGTSLGNLYTNRNNVTYFYNNGNPSITYNTIMEDTTIATQNCNGTYLISKNKFIQIPYGNFTCNQYVVYYDYRGKKSVFNCTPLFGQKDIII
jgi:hypothetical protein